MTVDNNKSLGVRGLIAKLLEYFTIVYGVVVIIIFITDLTTNKFTRKNENS